MLYGLIGVAIINVFLALSLGEFASAYPSAGGQVRPLPSLSTLIRPNSESASLRSMSGRLFLLVLVHDARSPLRLLGRVRAPFFSQVSSR